MNFPVFPILFFKEASHNDIMANIVFSAILVAMALIVCACLLTKMAKSHKYTRANSIEGFTFLIIAAVTALLGVYNIATLVVIAVVAYIFIWWVMWKLIIRIVIWRFLIKFVLWSVLIKNAIALIWPDAKVLQPRPKSKKEGQREGNS